MISVIIAKTSDFIFRKVTHKSTDYKSHIYDEVYEDAAEEIYDKIYDDLLDDMYDDIYEGIIDDAYDHRGTLRTDQPHVSDTSGSVC